MAQASLRDIGIVNGSIEALPLVTNTFDVVVAQGVIETLADPTVALIEMLRVARLVVVFTTPCADRDILGRNELPGVGWIQSNAWSRHRISAVAKQSGVRLIEEPCAGRGLFALLKV